MPRRAPLEALARGMGLAWMAWCASARAESPEPASATLRCEQRSQKGRVVCEAEVELEGSGAAGTRLVWADAVVQAAPPFAEPLRGRVGFDEATARTETRARLPIALIATEQGEGTLAVIVRVVRCDADGAGCHPERVRARAHLRVGPLR